ncbi:tRNA glutamyl-Q(34) synthetase GluQRS [Ancylobacter polymorphus]|uniref:tRNA glutamyl-Q(34) synthetase GluQRS n=1 Tax=Ancylobacter polymorphus TaxID=223390 RepID=A0A9E7CXP7_9HYPH|nr:tRNA glutamyl-Q(34) synthetase GluQRS [Ancylobacter polymorphus]UOK72624.1 tRNA glutamyl-Q(34) synthetase GluQRS [Ancylobacter polymorphus]
MTHPVFRFAPSPNGPLHLGHARSALINDALARASEGRLLLRIEDIDATRCRPEFEAGIYEDLTWLGLDWEQPVRRQSQHFADYRSALARLEALDLIYPSFETRGDIRRAVAGRSGWPSDPDGAPLFPFPRAAMSAAERARRVAAGEPYALRLDMARAVERAGPLAWREVDAAGEVTNVAADPLAWGDVILARKEMPTAYHLAVVVDDALQGVTHVVRGADLKAATSVHRLLQVLLGLPAPLYTHHALLLDAEGRKLSKSIGSQSLASLRAEGVTPEEVRRRALETQGAGKSGESSLVRK